MNKKMRNKVPHFFIHYQSGIIVFLGTSLRLIIIPKSSFKCSLIVIGSLPTKGLSPKMALAELICASEELS
jgi:hypothetical protein